MTTILATPQTTPRYRPPAGACDCHTHVFGPADVYPYAAGRTYTPPDASLADLKRLHAHLGIDRVVIVHPSPYGSDNCVSVDAMTALGVRRARGVAVIDPAISKADLDALDASGMRGARENIETAGVVDAGAAWARIEATAQRIAALGWHLQIFTRLSVIAALEEKLAALPVPVVIDHFGRAEAALGVRQTGFDALCRLVGSGKAYVKLSASYRVSTRADAGDVAVLARALIEANSDRCVWGTDWPHPGGGGARGASHREAIEPFQMVDDGAALDRLAAWAGGDEGLLRKILVDNPARLYGF